MKIFNSYMISAEYTVYTSFVVYSEISVICNKWQRIEHSKNDILLSNDQCAAHCLQKPIIIDSECHSYQAENILIGQKCVGMDSRPKMYNYKRLMFLCIKIMTFDLDKFTLENVYH